MQPGVVAVFVVLAFAGASFFFALAETALLSLTKWQAEQLVDREPRRGPIVVRLLQDGPDLLATMVLGNTFAMAGMLAVGLWMALNGTWPVAVTIVLLLLVILFACEVVPKTLSVRQPELWALRVARPLLWMHLLARPLRQVAQWIIGLILNRFVSRTMKPLAASVDQDYAELLELAYQQGALARSEKEIILEIIQLDRRTAGEVMKPRSQMAAIPDDLSIEQMVEAARKYKHRRRPIDDETPDTIVGILNTRALLMDPQINLEDAIEFPSFVPESMNLLQLLKSLQRQQRGMAIVMDEFGGTAGIVTTEDILEEMIGQIRGEKEPSEFVMEKLGQGRWRVSGSLRLDDFRREYPELGEVEEVETMGGLLTQLTEVVPAVGESARFRGLKLTAQAADERRVREVLVEVAR